MGATVLAGSLGVNRAAVVFWLFFHKKRIPAHQQYCHLLRLASQRLKLLFGIGSTPEQLYLAHIPADDMVGRLHPVDFQFPSGIGHDHSVKQDFGMPPYSRVVRQFTEGAAIYNHQLYFAAIRVCHNAGGTIDATYHGQSTEHMAWCNKAERLTAQ